MGIINSPFRFALLMPIAWPGCGYIFIIYNIERAGRSIRPEIYRGLLNCSPCSITKIIYMRRTWVLFSSRPQYFSPAFEPNLAKTNLKKFSNRKTKKNWIISYCNFLSSLETPKFIIQNSKQLSPLNVAKCGQISRFYIRRVRNIRIPLAAFSAEKNNAYF